MGLNFPGDDWLEPESTFLGEYPYAHVTETESGHLFALDDTKDSETVRLAHRLGTFTEFQTDGTRVDKIVGDNYQIIVKNNNVLIKGTCSITIEGDSMIHVKGDADMKIDGDAYTKVEGDLHTKAVGDVSLFAGGDVDIAASGETGTVTINAPDGVNINGDLSVNGILTTEQSIFSKENISAQKQIFSYLGIQTTGGINCGIYNPLPPAAGIILASSWIEAPTVVGRVAVADSLGFMNNIRTIYNSHHHTNEGFSNPVIPVPPIPVPFPPAYKIPEL